VTLNTDATLKMNYYGEQPITIILDDTNRIEQTVAGNDTPDDRVIDIGKAHTTITFHYETYSIKDQIDIYYKNGLVFSSGCIGTKGERITFVVLNDNESSLRVNVILDCAGETGTA